MSTPGERRGRLQRKALASRRSIAAILRPSGRANRDVGLVRRLSPVLAPHPLILRAPRGQVVVPDERGPRGLPGAGITSSPARGRRRPRSIRRTSPEDASRRAGMRGVYRTLDAVGKTSRRISTKHIKTNIKGVIPGHRKAVSPESIAPEGAEFCGRCVTARATFQRPWLWIPGPSLRSVPE